MKLQQMELTEVIYLPDCWHNIFHKNTMNRRTTAPIIFNY